MGIFDIFKRKESKATEQAPVLAQLQKENDTLKKALVEDKIHKKAEITRDRIFHEDSHIKKWKNAIEYAVTPPYYRKLYITEVCNQALFDAHLRSQLNTRRKGTLAEKYALLKDGQIDEAQTKIIQAVWFEAIIKAIIDSIFFWGAGVELTKEKNGEIKAYYIKPAHICNHRKALIPAPGYTESVPFEAFPNALFFCNDEEEGLGLVPLASRYTIYKSFSLSDWSRHSELFGTPFLKMKTPVTEKPALEERHKALGSFGRSAYVILDMDEELEALDPKTPANPHQMYLDMLHTCNEEISKAIVGQTGTTEQKSYVGAAEVHERILDWYVEADMLLIQKIINNYVLPFLAKRGWIAEGYTFDWLYFVEKKKKKPVEDKPAQEAPETEDLNYNAFLESLKKKGIKPPALAKLAGKGFSFEDIWGDTPDHYTLFNHYLKAFQKPINDLLPEGKLKDSFTENAYELALAKTKTFLEGTKNATKEEAKALFNKLKRYTETEQVQIALSAQAAEEWQQLWEDRDKFPNLRYVAVGDENTRESHRALSGVVKPIGDPFWDTYYPPIAYRCRCTVRQERGDVAITQNLPKNLPKIDRGLGHNPGKSGKIFDLKHPYFTNTPLVLLESVQAYANYGKEYKREYFDVQTGGYTVRHAKHTDKKIKEHLMIAKILNQKTSAKIELLPVSNKTSPDLSYNGIKADFKSPKDATKLKNFVKRGIEDANKQGEMAILYLPENYNYASLMDGFKKHIEFKEKDDSAIEAVVVVTQNKTIAIIKNEDFDNGSWIEKVEYLKK